MDQFEEIADMQVITLDHPENAVVFTEDERVFYDLSALVSQATHQTVQATIALMLQDPAKQNPELEGRRMYMLGIADFVQSLMQQRDNLRAKFVAHREVAEVDSVADLLAGFGESEAPTED